MEDSSVVGRVYIAEVIIPPDKEQKIREKHGLTGDDVREAIIYGRDVRAKWVDDDIHGARVEARTTAHDGRAFVAYLDPLNSKDPNQGSYKLRTAYFDT